MTNHYSVVIVGGGQAGLSISYCLKERGVEHIVFEKNQIASAWRSQRWDSFCLVTPNWQCQLPGYPYSGDQPEGFIKKDEIVEYIENYARSFNPPIREGVEVLAVSRGDRGIFEIKTSIGDYTADQAVIAAGAYHQPKIPSIAERLPQHILQLHSSKYKNPESLLDGAVLVIGTGQSGCQIAEDLHLAGRQVHLCVGGAPRSPRRYRGKDAVEWLAMMGYYDLSIDQHPQKEKVRAKANHYLTGRDGGREIDLRRFAIEGMQLHGRLKSITPKENSIRLEFFNDLKHNLDSADAVSESIKRTIDNFIEKNQIDTPSELPYQPLWQPEIDIPEIDLAEANISTVIWCTGFESDFGWIKIPVFDGKGYPGHDRGVTDVKGLYFLGLPWLYTWGSGRFSGVAKDATYLADYIMARRRVTQPQNDWAVVNEFLLGS